MADPVSKSPQLSLAVVGTTIAPGAPSAASERACEGPADGRRPCGHSGADLTQR
jgi:hypothetical protein